MSSPEQTPEHSTDNTEPKRANPGLGNDQTADPAEGDTAPTESPAQDGSPATGSTDAEDGA